MNCESLCDDGLSLGIEYAALLPMADGQIVKFMRGRQTDVTFIVAYDRGIWFIDRVITGLQAMRFSSHDR
jgi:hypothetical protein